MVEAEEVISAKVEESDGIMEVTRPFGKQPEILKEPSEEGGVFMPSTIRKSGPLLAIIVVRSTTAKRSTGKRKRFVLHKSGSHQLHH